jgi:TolB-like protein/Flp pilus assembly protein TadD
MLGQTISHYRVLSKLGEGGMGIVYKAEDLKLHRFVALKVFPAILAASPDDRARFFQEARLASSLNHPNIVTIHEFDEIDGTAFIASECVEGRTLAAVLQDGLLAVDRVLEVAISIAAGIADAHAHGIVHRDIKPENVMISVQGQVKVMDFGLARLMGSSHVTSPGSLIGTFAYMSPEQINEEEIDARSDIFSFGTLLYLMTAGELPFKGKTVAELLTSITRKHPDSPARLRPGVSGELVRIIQKAMQKDRHRRYRSMEEVKADLERLRAHPGMRRTIDATMLTPRVAASAAAVLLVLAAGAAFLLRGEPDAAVQKSVAVLPFTNAVQDSASNFLSVGFADDIITRLSYVRSLLVRPTSAVLRFDGRAVEAAAAGSELSADVVLQGRYQRAAERLYVSFQLVDVHTGGILLADRLDIPWRDMRAVQDNISERIVDALQIRLSAGEVRALHKVNTSSHESYESYLRGITYMNKSSMVNNGLAIEMFERAVALDTLFAQAYARLCDVYVEQFWSNYSTDTGGGGGGEASARKAIALDPGLAMAHSGLGFALRIRGDYPAGVRESFRALALDPHASSSLEDVGVFYQYRGDFAKAREIFDRAAAADPTLNIDRVMARMYMFEGKYREAVFHLQRAVQRSPDDAWFRAGLLAVCYVRLGDLTKADEAIARAAQSEPTSPQVDLARAILETERGNRMAADSAIARIRPFVERDYAMARQVAAVYARQGRRDEAIAWLRRATRLGNYWYSWYTSDTWFDGIRNDTAFQAQMAEMERTLTLVAAEVQEQGY